MPCPLQPAVFYANLSQSGRNKLATPQTSQQAHYKYFCRYAILVLWEFLEQRKTNLSSQSIFRT